MYDDFVWPTGEWGSLEISPTELPGSSYGDILCAAGFNPAIAFPFKRLTFKQKLLLTKDSSYISITQKCKFLLSSVVLQENYKGLKINGGFNREDTSYGTCVSIRVVAFPHSEDKGVVSLSFQMKLEEGRGYICEFIEFIPGSREEILRTVMYNADRFPLLVDGDESSTIRVCYRLGKISQK